MKIDRSWYEKPPGIPERTGAGGVIVRFDLERPLVALARPKGDPHFVLPKGGAKRDETLIEAARREIREEIGLFDLHVIRELGVRERLNSRRTRWGITHYFLFVAPDPLVVDEGTPEFDLSWHPLDALPTMFWPEQRSLITENRAGLLALSHTFVP